MDRRQFFVALFTPFLAGWSRLFPKRNVTYIDTEEKLVKYFGQPVILPGGAALRYDSQLTIRLIRAHPFKFYQL